MLEVGDGHDRLTVDHGEETVIVSVGHAQPALTRHHAAAAASPEDVLVSGTWTTPDTYVLTCRFVESPFVADARPRRSRTTTSWSRAGSTWRSVRRRSRALVGSLVARRLDGRVRLGLTSVSCSSSTVHQSLTSRSR